jgi:hypothetical protein
LVWDKLLLALFHEVLLDDERVDVAKQPEIANFTGAQSGAGAFVCEPGGTGLLPQAIRH